MILADACPSSQLGIFAQRRDSHDQQLIRLDTTSVAGWRREQGLTREWSSSLQLPPGADRIADGPHQQTRHEATDQRQLARDALGDGAHHATTTRGAFRSDILAER
jgi:hypothetical protein